MSRSWAVSMKSGTSSFGMNRKESQGIALKDKGDKPLNYPFFGGTLFLKFETLFHVFETGFLNIGTSHLTERVDFMIMKRRSNILKHRSNILKPTVSVIVALSRLIFMFRRTNNRIIVVFRLDCGFCSHDGI